METRTGGHPARQSLRDRAVFLPLLAAFMLLAAMFAVPAFAVHDDGLFELDRNAASEAAVDGEDWDVVYAGTDTAAASTFTFDGIGPTIFTGGGSKDDLNTTGWKHKSGQTPDKDELLDGYAARYGDNIYFGADRYSNSGDAVMGFWFFQQEVVAQDGGTFGPGQHEDGDILILSDFSGGGGNVTIRVYQWNAGSGAISGTLDLIAGDLGSPADCVGPPSVPNNDPYCATVNTTGITSPWPFTPKSGPTGTIPTGHFYEGGIDLAFLGLEDECFASFLAESRSSTSVNATLKDFVGGTFEACETSTVTTPSDSLGNPVSSIVLGQAIYDHALVIGTGSSKPPTGSVSFWICAPDELTSGACQTPDGTFVSTNAVTQVGSTSTSEALSSAFTPDEIGTWCWRGEYSGDDNYPPSGDSSTGECFTVKDIATTTTAQSWLPQDTATITTAGGSTVAGTVTFKLYENATCTAPAAQTFADRPVTAGTASTNNTTYYTTVKTISWRAVFTSTNDVDSGNAAHCETMTVSILNNDTGS